VRVCWETNLRTNSRASDGTRARRVAGPTRVDSGAYLVALVREPDPNRRREHPRGLQATCDVGDAETRVASAKGRRRALRGWRDSRCGNWGDGRAGGVFVAHRCRWPGPCRCPCRRR
jgi:hypothetical protein